MLVSKKFTLHPGDPAVEVLAGEDTAQPYELHVSANGPLWIGDSDVSQADSAPLGGPYRPSGVSMWVIAPTVSSQTNFDVTVFAYSTE